MRSSTIIDKSLKLFIKDASTDSLKSMIMNMKEYHKKFNENKTSIKENVQSNSNQQKSVPAMSKKLKKINLTTDLKTLNRKRQMKALLQKDPNLMVKRLRQQRKIEEAKKTAVEETVSH